MYSNLIEHKYKGKNLLLITKGEHNKRILSAQLENLIGDKVGITSFCVDTMTINSYQVVDHDLVVVSSKSLLERLPQEVKDADNILVARRSINYSMIYKLLSIPPMTKIMVVNDRKETAEELVSLIYSIGFKNLRLIPAFPGMPSIPSIDTAITPAEPQYVPAWVNNLIDIGVRTIDLSTLMEILVRLDLVDEATNRLSAKYISEVIEISGKLTTSFMEIEHLKNTLETVLNNIGDGIIAVDTGGFIKVFNQAAQNQLGVSASEAQGQNISQVVPTLDIRACVGKGKRELNVIEKHFGQEYIVNKIPLSSGGLISFYKLGEFQKLENKLRAAIVKKGHVAKYHFEDIKTVSVNVLDLINKGKKIAQNNANLLIIGETGTGKELFAGAVHNLSSRKEGPFVAVNCAALPRDLLESELFGYEEGAFTGAKKGGKAGFFEQAHTGTIFLDEIGDISLDVQMRLLRVLQEREVIRVGSENIIPVDVRVIAATNRKLKRMMEEGLFRDDLYYRLNTFPVYIPALRERKEDIIYLANWFLENLEADLNADQFFSPEVAELFSEYPWPGNIRELENTIQSLWYTVEGRKVELQDLPMDLLNFYAQPPGQSSTSTLMDSDVSDFILAIEGTNTLHYVAILRLLAQKKKDGIGLGRTSLTEELNKAGYPETPDTVRRKLETLAKRGLIDVFQGRKGSVITQKGLVLLRHLEGRSH